MIAVKSFGFGIYAYTLYPFVELVKQSMGKNWRGIGPLFYLLFACAMNIALMLSGALTGYVLGESKMAYWALVPAVVISLASSLFDFKIEVDTPEEV